METNNKEKIIVDNQNLIYKLAWENYKKINVEVEDLFQEFMMLLWRKLDFYDATKSQVTTFIYMVCNMYCKGVIRGSYNGRFQDRRTQSFSSDAFLVAQGIDEYGIEDISQSTHMNLTIYESQKLNFLKYVVENCSDVLYEYYILGKKQAEIAKEKNVSRQRIGTIIKAELEKYRKQYTIDWEN